MGVAFLPDFYPVSTLMVSCFSWLAYFETRSAVIFIFISLYIMSLFSLADFKIFTLFLVFRNLNMMSGSDMCIVVGIYPTWDSLNFFGSVVWCPSFHYFWKTLCYVSSNISSAYSVFSSEIAIICILVCETIWYCPWAVGCSVLFWGDFSSLFLF